LTTAKKRKGVRKNWKTDSLIILIIIILGTDFGKEINLARKNFTKFIPKVETMKLDKRIVKKF
jgi:hypothetical protein